ncbi:MAG: SpoIID/LytB domain-containing protein [Bacteroidales bacterium]|jgi:stage II sporulation protein D|nr:SpoIID/LytB domain-containing protein [Bacteroidales bacterium]
MKRKLLIITLLLLSASMTLAQKVRIRVFADTKLDNAELRASFGTYELYFNDTIRADMKRNSKIELTAKGNTIRISLNDSTIGRYTKVKLVATGLKCFFSITPDGNEKLKRMYDDDITVYANSNSLILINEVAYDNYIAAVVQSETWGATSNVEFFKVQALCCRNYMYKNLNKHAKDGYNLCDDVHCQVYKGRANKPEVIEAVYKTKGEVIVDNSNSIIETPFHSNSGGETLAAVDVWGKDVPYLVSVQDSFSLASRNLLWEKTIRIRQWQNYFKEKGIDIKDSANLVEIMSFSQKDGRKKDLLGVPLVQIRKDFGLKSTFFSVQEWGSDVKLTGKGYGHGVGLSQEGAINMCEQGYEYWEVIQHYFPSCAVVKEEDLK